MNFGIAVNTPVVLQLGDKTITLPRMRVRDWAQLSAELDAERTAAATKGMTPSERFRHLSMCPVAPSDFDDLNRFLFTPVGAQKIIRLCAKNGGIDPEDVDQLLDVATPGEVEMLSLELSALRTKSLPEPAQEKKDDTATFSTEGKPKDPLTSSAPGSNA